MVTDFTGTPRTVRMSTWNPKNGWTAMAHEEEAQQDESGCAVDWSWLQGQEIESVWSNLERLELRFKNGLTLKVMAAQWKGSAYLAFDPYKAPGT